MNEDAVNWVRPHAPSKIVGISLVTQGLSGTQAQDAIKQVTKETGLLNTNVWRFGAGVLLDALIRNFTA